MGRDDEIVPDSQDEAELDTSELLQLGRDDSPPFERLPLTNPSIPSLSTSPSYVLPRPMPYKSRPNTSVGSPISHYTTDTVLNTVPHANRASAITTDTILNTVPRKPSTIAAFSSTPSAKPRPRPIPSYEDISPVKDASASRPRALNDPVISTSAKGPAKPRARPTPNYEDTSPAKDTSTDRHRVITAASVKPRVRPTPNYEDTSPEKDISTSRPRLSTSTSAKPRPKPKPDFENANLAKSPSAAHKAHALPMPRNMFSVDISERIKARRAGPKLLPSFVIQADKEVGNMTKSDTGAKKTKKTKTNALIDDEVVEISSDDDVLPGPSRLRLPPKRPSKHAEKPQSDDVLGPIRAPSIQPARPAAADVTRPAPDSPRKRKRDADTDTAAHITTNNAPSGASTSGISVPHSVSERDGTPAPPPKKKRNIAAEELDSSASAKPKKSKNKSKSKDVVVDANGAADECLAPAKPKKTKAKPKDKEHVSKQATSQDKALEPKKPRAQAKGKEKEKEQFKSSEFILDSDDELALGNGDGAGAGAGAGAPTTKPPVDAPAPSDSAPLPVSSKIHGTGAASELPGHDPELPVKEGPKKKAASKKRKTGTEAEVESTVDTSEGRPPSKKARRSEGDDGSSGVQEKPKRVAAPTSDASDKPDPAVVEQRPDTSNVEEEVPKTKRKKGGRIVVEDEEGEDGSKENAMPLPKTLSTTTSAQVAAPQKPHLASKPAYPHPPKNRPLADILQRINGASPRPRSSPSVSRNFLKGIAPLHRNRRTPPPPPPPRIMPKKTKKELEREERWEEELQESVEGWGTLEEGERERLRREKRDWELGGCEE